MARFVLQQGKTVIDLGRQIFSLGILRSKMRDAEGVSQEHISEAQDTLKYDILDVPQSVPPGIDAPEGSQPQVKVELHYDGMEGNDYVLHIVVPDMGQKRIPEAISGVAGTDHDDASRQLREEEFAAYDFTRFAFECMGSATIRGCGQ